MNALLESEIETLQSIYGAEKIEVSYPTHKGGFVIPAAPLLIEQSVNIKIASITFQFNSAIYVLVEVFSDYPTQSPHAEMIMNKRIPAKELLDILVSNILLENLGHECLFQLIEGIRTFLENHGLIDDVDIQANHEDKDEGIMISANSTSHTHNKRSGVSSSSSSGSKPGIEQVEHLTIIHGEITKERKSTFQSHLCSVHSMADVDLFRRTVLSDKRIAQATHNITAYRFTGPLLGHNTTEQGIVSSSSAYNVISFHDYDSDGEIAAGGKLAEMMRLMCVGGVAVIVSRWFGGVLLGSDRFKLICNSARKLLEENQYGSTNNASCGDIVNNVPLLTHKKKS